MNRRSFFKAAGLAGAAPMLNVGRYRLFAQSGREYSARAIELALGGVEVALPAGGPREADPRVERLFPISGVPEEALEGDVRDLTLDVRARLQEKKG